MEVRDLYKNASIIIGGALCAVLMTNNILGRMSNWNEPSVFPGFRVMAGLCYPILFCWVGMLLRFWKQNPKWWIQLIIVGISIFCIYRYRHFAENWGFIGFLYIAMAGIGYLIPTKVLVDSSRNRGWISLIMVAFSAFCYTVLTTAKNRLLWGPLMPGHEDMELMLETILVNAEPLMVIVVAYFVGQFGFSRIAQNMGSKSWFRGIVAVPCIYTFIGSFFRLFTMGTFFMISYMYYSPLLWFIVQPVTIYLVVVLARILKERRKEKKDRTNWKELAKI